MQGRRRDCVMTAVRDDDVLTVKHIAGHPYASWRFEVASSFLENVCTPANKVKLNFHQPKS